MSRRSRPPTVRDLRARRDVIMGDQVNLLAADLSRVEGLLSQILELLRQPQPAVHIERDARQSVIVVGSGNVVGSGSQVRFAAADLGVLGALQRQADPLRCEEIYLARFVLNETYARWSRGYLPLKGMLTPALRLSDREDQGLSPAGVPLEDVRQALTEHSKPRLVILGEPGAGKTTTLHCLAFDLACERLRDPLRGKLPLRADLFNFIGDRLPSEFLKAEWETSGLQEPYGQAVAQGQVCFLLDGVNQMPYHDLAGRIERWADWAGDKLPPGNWAVFTCRTADYMPTLRLPEVRIQSLDPGRMRRYFELRFGPQRAPELWHEFEQRLHAGDDRFERLARNPFMLSLLTDRCEEGQSLTGSRARLMDDLARRLVGRELEQGRQPEALTAHPRITLPAEMEALSRLAFAMQARGEGTGLARVDAARVRLGDAGQAPLALDVVLDLAVDATVLEQSEGDGEAAVYSFYHHLLQEYFAARELWRRFRAGERLARYWRVPWRTWQFLPKRLQPGERVEPPPVTRWDETVVMAAALAGQDAVRFVAAVREGNLPLAGRCLAEVRGERAELAALVEQVQGALLARQRSPSAHLRARIDAGLALGELGHPDLRPQPFEFEGRTVWAILPSLQAVPAGPFVRGSERAERDAYPDEYTAERSMTLPGYAIGRYPVTNAEYALFVRSGGYRDERWWSEAGRQWRQGGPDAHAGPIGDWLGFRALLRERNVEQIARRLNWRPQELRYWQEMVQLSEEEARERARQVFERPFDRPAYWDDRELGSPGRPVVGVNWYEAAAYCRWLSAVSGREFRLPTEAEWEKAARGTDGRAYPWGDRFDPALCNTVESHVYTTTPVGLYAGGVSPYGLFDAAGNVWEWTGDWYQMYAGGEPSDDFGERYRVVRGGSWARDRGYARCAYRNWFVPVNFGYSMGLRVVFPGSISAS